MSSEVSFGLAGRVCIVTGGAQGIGEACCRRFAREQAHVIVVDIDDVRGSALATELGATYIHCDVGDKSEVDAVVAHALRVYGHIDVLVNNAGIFKAANFLDVTEDDFDAVLRINLKGSFLMGQAAARALVMSHIFCSRWKVRSSPKVPGPARIIPVSPSIRSSSGNPSV